MMKERKNSETSVEYIKTMETYCVSSKKKKKKNTANNNSSVSKTKQNRLMLLSNCQIVLFLAG